MAPPVGGRWQGAMCPARVRWEIGKRGEPGETAEVGEIGDGHCLARKSSGSAWGIVLRETRSVGTARILAADRGPSLAWRCPRTAIGRPHAQPQVGDGWRRRLGDRCTAGSHSLRHRVEPHLTAPLRPRAWPLRAARWHAQTGVSTPGPGARSDWGATACVGTVCVLLTGRDGTMCASPLASARVPRAGNVDR